MNKSVANTVYSLDAEDCGYPEKGLNTIMRLDDGRAVHSCEDGYAIKGQESRYCQLDGSWSGEVPTCLGLYFFCICVSHVIPLFSCFIVQRGMP